MILVDSSVWIDWLRGAKAKLPDGQLFELATCGPVLQQVLQGLEPGWESERFRRSFLALPLLGDPVPAALYRAAADLFRTARSKGFTIRSSMDCLIAAIAIENEVPIWHLDRDYNLLARCTALRIYRGR